MLREKAEERWRDRSPGACRGMLQDTGAHSCASESPGRLVNAPTPGPTHRVSETGGLEGVRFCISNRSPGNSIMLAW